MAALILPQRMCCIRARIAWLVRQLLPMTQADTNSMLQLHYVQEMVRAACVLPKRSSSHCSQTRAEQAFECLLCLFFHFFSIAAALSLLFAICAEQCKFADSFDSRKS